MRIFHPATYLSVSVCCLCVCRAVRVVPTVPGEDSPESLGSTSMRRKSRLYLLNIISKSSEWRHHQRPEVYIINHHSRSPRLLVHTMRCYIRVSTLYFVAYIMPLPPRWYKKSDIDQAYIVGTKPLRPGVVVGWPYNYIYHSSHPSPGVCVCASAHAIKTNSGNPMEILK